MTRYKFDRGGHLIDQDGNVILTIMATNCSRKFRDMAGKEMANKLNGIEQGKEAAAYAKRERCGIHTFVTSDVCGCDRK